MSPLQPIRDEENPSKYSGIRKSGRESSELEGMHVLQEMLFWFYFLCSTLTLTYLVEAWSFFVFFAGERECNSLHFAECRVLAMVQVASCHQSSGLRYMGSEKLIVAH